MTTIQITINIVTIKVKISPHNITSRYRGGRGIRSKNRENTFRVSKRKWEYNIKIGLSEI